MGSCCKYSGNVSFESDHSGVLVGISCQTHLRPTISLEQLLAFLCHNSPVCRQSVSRMRRGTQSIVSLSLSLSPTLCRILVMHAWKHRIPLTLLCYMQSGNLISWSLVPFNVTSSSIYSCGILLLTPSWASSFFRHTGSGPWVTSVTSVATMVPLMRDKLCVMWIIESRVMLHQALGFNGY